MINTLKPRASIKPCPKCLGWEGTEVRSEPEVEFNNGEIAPMAWDIKCYPCGVETDWYKSQGEAIGSWNRRRDLMFDE